MQKLSSADRINYLNIGLMLISVVLAYIVPFELFLFSYAILGPLHYLTEVSWLEKKGYFVKSKHDVWLLVFFVFVITIYFVSQSPKAAFFMATLLFAGLAYALVIILVDSLPIKLLFAFFILSISGVLNFKDFDSIALIIFAVWLPTIIHVYLFTGLFMLFGVLKSRSKTGLLSVLFFVACALLFFAYNPENVGIPVTEYGKEAYTLFKVLNMSLYHYLGYGDFVMTDQVLFYGEKSIMIMRFIAFAYTYHYLNWFSKTTAIQWNDVSQKRMIVIITLWVLSVGLYVASYKVGMFALFLLSMLHVFLEFPLNHRSVIGIGQEVKTIIREKKF